MIQYNYYYTKDHQGRSTSHKGGAFLLLCITQAALRFDYIAKRRKNVRSVVTKNPSSNEITGVQQTHYYPFGGIIADLSTGRDVQNRLYNGKEQDFSNNLFWLDFGARQYDPTRGQFTIPDPLAEKYYPWNYFTYCVNNPLKFIDPDGRMPTVIIGGLLGAGLDYGVQVVANVIDGKGFNSFTDVDGKSIAISAASGAAGAGIVSKAEKLSKVAMVLLDGTNNALTGGASTVNDKISKGEDINISDVAKGAKTGVVSGAAGNKMGAKTRNSVVNSDTQKVFDRQADRARRLNDGRKSRTEAAKKTAKVAKDNKDNKEIVASSVVSKFTDVVLNTADKFIGIFK